jgi:hypothetical protein
MPDDFKGKDLALNLGIIWQVEETYINDIRIGSNGKWGRVKIKLPEAAS